MELNQPLKAEFVKPDERKPEQVIPSIVTELEVKKIKPQQRDTVIPRNHDTMKPRHHDTVIQIVRAAVKQFGKEAATHRFTLDEKKAIADLVYAYRKENIKTSENEISRIGVNFLIEDFKANGEKSILSQVLYALNR